MLTEILEGQTMSGEMKHVPVMQNEVIRYLNLRPGMCVVDATLGMGGHAFEILKGIGRSGQFIGIDRDGNSLKMAQERLKEFADNCHFIQSDFRHLGSVLGKLNIQEVDGILLDLGISSYQLENPERGFSIKFEGPLDMRMDQESYISAYDLVNSLSEKEIFFILRNFGEERWSGRIAQCIIKEREKAPIESTSDLSRVVLKAVPRRFQNQKIHPATRTFQAFRIAVNRELEALDKVLDGCVHLLKDQARLCVISFHSLEDRIVKEKFRQFLKSGDIRLIEKKPIIPEDSEIQANPRSRSAKLRVAERVK